MDNRCTIVTRLHTADGLVSEIYTGDTDVEQSIIVAIIHDELAPRLLGRSATDPEGAWLAMEPATSPVANRFYNVAHERLRILGEIPVRKFGKPLPMARAPGPR